MHLGVIHFEFGFLWSLEGADRIPLPNIPWPILGAAPDSGDALVKDVEKKHGPLGNELLKAVL